jgi:hypothetical protein
VLSENNTVQGIHALQVWPEGEESSRRARHAAVLEADQAFDKGVLTVDLTRLTFEPRQTLGERDRMLAADEKATVGQKVYTIAREAMAGVLQFAQGLFAQGRTCGQVLEVLMPA